VIKQLVKKLISYLSRFDQVHQEDLVLSLVLNTASLALKKEEYVEFAPIKGTCGSFKLKGNSLPEFTYTVFEKKLMEFIEVRVQVARPDQISFKSTISSTTAPERHGEEVETKDKYKEPFMTLAHHLFSYFPFPMGGGRKKELPSSQERIESLRNALDQIRDPRKRGHNEPDTYTELGCVMNIADQTLTKDELLAHGGRKEEA
jgi:hypothetical protein